MASWTAAASPFQRAAPHLHFAFGPPRAIGLWIALLALPYNSWFARNSNAQEGAKIKVKLEAPGPALTIEEIHGFEAEIGGRGKWRNLSDSPNRRKASDSLRFPSDHAWRAKDPHIDSSPLDWHHWPWQ